MKNPTNDWRWRRSRRDQSRSIHAHVDTGSLRTSVPHGKFDHVRPHKPADTQRKKRDHTIAQLSDFTKDVTMTKPPPLDLHGTVPLSDQFAPGEREDRIAELIEANNAMLERARRAEKTADAWKELALTSGRKLARLRETITELAKSSSTVTMSTREVRQVLVQRIFATLINVMDEKD